MYDSTNVADIPAHATLILTYIDGRYQTDAAVRHHFPNAQIVTCTVLGTPGANVADCEQGDLTPASAAQWAKNEITAGRHPTIYCSQSTWPDVRSAVHHLNLTDNQVSWFVAHYDGIPTIPPGAIAKQYQSDTNANLDTSVVADYWPGVDPTPPPPPTPPEAPDMLTMHYQDPIDGSIGFTDDTGTLITYNNDGSPGGHFLGNLINHPDYHAGRGQPEGPVIGITWWRDAGDNVLRGFCGYVIWCQDAHGNLHPYSFPSDGRHAGTNQ